MSENHLTPWVFLPCAPDVCQACAVKHDPTWPHDKESLFYQMAFYREHGRWPTWRDAMAHCSPRLQELWVKQLVLRGIDVDQGLDSAADANAAVDQGSAPPLGGRVRGRLWPR